MNKEEIKQHIVDYQTKIIADLEKAVEYKRAGSDLDESDTLDPEDYSHQEEAGELMLRLKGQLQTAEQEMHFLQEISTDELDKVVLGSLVETNQMVFYVGIATQPLEVEGKTVVGISTKAPIYSAMLNKTAGESFSFRDTDYEILSLS